MYLAFSQVRFFFSHPAGPRIRRRAQGADWCGLVCPALRLGFAAQSPYPLDRTYVVGDIVQTMSGSELCRVRPRVTRRIPENTDCFLIGSYALPNIVQLSFSNANTL